MAGPSKNSRASRNNQAARGGNARVKILIPLGAGAGAYVVHPESMSTRRFTVAGEDFAAAITALAEAGFGAQLREELAELHAAQPGHGWDATEQRLVAAGALS